MASIGITSSIYRAGTKKPSTPARPPRSFITNQANDVVALNVKLPDKYPLVTSGNPKEHRDETVYSKNSDEQTRPRFSDERWKNGTWDLNMFVKQGRMDWDSLIVAEAGRRKYLEMHPEASTNDEPVEFRSSIIPWWAWIVHSHLPEAELLNGRAAIVGFFMAYLVDALTGLDVVGQNGNFVCKAALFFTIVAVLLSGEKKMLRIYGSLLMRLHFTTSNGKHPGKITIPSKRELVRMIIAQVERDG